MDEILQLWSPAIQGGFAVFALALLGVNVWLIKQLLRVLADTNQVIAGNTRAIESVAGVSHDSKQLIEQLRNELLKRPCLMEASNKRHQDPMDAKTP